MMAYEAVLYRYARAAKKDRSAAPTTSGGRGHRAAGPMPKIRVNLLYPQVRGSHALEGQCGRGGGLTDGQCVVPLIRLENGRSLFSFFSPLVNDLSR